MIFLPLKLQDAFERVSEDNAHLKRDLSLATKKEEKGSSMVTELTSVSFCTWSGFLQLTDLVIRKLFANDCQFLQKIFFNF